MHALTTWESFSTIYATHPAHYRFQLSNILNVSTHNLIYRTTHRRNTVKPCNYCHFNTGYKNHTLMYLTVDNLVFTRSLGDAQYDHGCVYILFLFLVHIQLISSQSGTRLDMDTLFLSLSIYPLDRRNELDGDVVFGSFSCARTL